MPDTDGAALCHGDAEQISEHDDVDTIGTGGERFHSQHVEDVYKRQRERMSVSVTMPIGAVSSTI